jgi:hypothetical protein
VGLYEQDLYVWSCCNVQLLREGRFAEADMEHVEEEIASCHNEQEHRLESQLARLLLHLVKYRYQPSRRSRSWQIPIVNARIKIRRYLRRNPGLKSHVAGLLLNAYNARRKASVETGLPKETFPTECSCTLEQIMDDDFLAL